MKLATPTTAVRNCWQSGQHELLARFSADGPTRHRARSTVPAGVAILRQCSRPHATASVPNDFAADCETPAGSAPLPSFRLVRHSTAARRSCRNTGKAQENRHHFGIHRGFSGGMWSLATPPDDEIMSGA
jgi:hypothetical protein